MNWLILILVALAAFVGLYALLVRPNLPRRDISPLQGYDYAHRGLWNAERPENSLAAFRAAADAGYGMEMDVHLTADGHLVVHHDDSLKRMTGVDIPIGRSTFAEVRACHLPNGESIPTFDELLEAVNGRVPLIVEVKVEDNADALCRAVYQRMQHYSGPWCMESFDPWAVQWFRRNAPEVIRGQLSFNHAGKGETAKIWWRNIGLASMLVNIWSRPDFVAFEAKSEKRWCLPMVLLRWMRPWFVAWTVRSREDMAVLRERYDLQIFEGFTPTNKHKKRVSRGPLALRGVRGQRPLPPEANAPCAFDCLRQSNSQPTQKEPDIVQ